MTIDQIVNKIENTLTERQNQQYDMRVRATDQHQNKCK